ncbi:RNA-directed DNA polymerase, eukaryota, reverse transcriptase zinc-binding domain protein [Tanacetum coccineum]
MFKWVWRFRNDGNSMWAWFIKAMYGKDGNLGTVAKRSHPSAWMDIVNELHKLKNQDLDLISLMKKKVGNGVDTLFWEEVWRGDNMFKSCFPRVYALEYDKSIMVAAKLAHDDLGSFVRRMPRDEAELMQFSELKTAFAGLQLPMIHDRWSWSIVGSRDFSVASVRKYIDDHHIVGNSFIARWVKAVPIKINIMAWKVRFDYLPTRLNLSRRGLDLQSILCPMCNKEVESNPFHGGMYVTRSFHHMRNG